MLTKWDPTEYRFYCTLIVVRSWPEDGRSRPKHVAKYNLIVIIASCLMCVVYWRCVIYYTDLITHNGMAPLSLSLSKKNNILINIRTQSLNISRYNIHIASTYKKFSVSQRGEIWSCNCGSLSWRRVASQYYYVRMKYVSGIGIPAILAMRTSSHLPE